MRSMHNGSIIVLLKIFTVITQQSIIHTCTYINRKLNNIIRNTINELKVSNIDSLKKH